MILNILLRCVWAKALPLKGGVSVALLLVGARRYQISSRPPAQFSMGQPTHETRNHYLPAPGYLTPAITALEYYNRRLELASKLPARSIALLVGNLVQYSSGSVFHEFQQDNDLYYLTGWLEPESVAIIEKKRESNDPEDVVFHMLVQPKNPSVELWEGERSGMQGAYDFFNADAVEDINKVESYIKSLLQTNENVYWDDKSSKKRGINTTSKFLTFFNNFTFNKIPNTINEVLRSSKNCNINPLTSLIAKQRAVKSPGEIAVMKKAGQISSRGINQAIAKVGSSLPIYTEKTLAKYLEYAFVKGGCDKQAYIPVVASGPNALTIHYTRNDDLLYRDEMVFVDAAGKLGGYCADISRTWPNSPNGFTKAQKQIYEIVLKANKVCIDLCFEDNQVSLNDIHEISVKVLTENLKDLPGFGMVTKSDVTRYLYPHYIGHHLGLDLHDVPSISRFAKLKAGNVITIEPGLYIPQNDKWPKEYQGIGVRVEDDIVVGKTYRDVINLTSGCVKEVADIESLIRLGKVTTPGVTDELVEVDIDV